MKIIIHKNLSGSALKPILFGMGMVLLVYEPTFAVAEVSLKSKTQQHAGAGKTVRHRKHASFLKAKGTQSISVRPTRRIAKNKAVPVQVVTSKDIAQTSATTLSDFLERMPSIGSSGSSNAEPSGGGVSCTDIRNLGQKEVVVLMDGKRMTMDGAAACVDTNVIPIQLIQSMDIMKDGGEAEFGGDALSGVLNIKLRHDLNTGGFNIRGGISDKGDGRSGLISAFKGWNFDGGRGNITVFGSYSTQEGIQAKDRSWANPVYDGKGGKITSPATADPTITNSAGKIVSGGNGAYDYSRQESLTNDLHTGSLYGDAHYDFNRHFTIYSNVLYSHRNSSSYSPPQPFNGVPSLSGDGSSVPSLPGDYPGNNFGGPVTINRARFPGLGERRMEGASDTYTVKAGFKGEIIDKWMYDASFTYGWNQATELDENQGNYGAWKHLMGIGSDGKYNPGLCSSNPGGKCIKPFTPTTSMTPAQLRFMEMSTHTHSYYQMRDWNFRVHKHQVVKMPWNKGGFLGVAFGFEHRGEQLAQKFDPMITSGNSMNLNSQNTAGGYTETSGYLQGTVHLFKNALWAKDLTIGAQGRVSNYSSVGLTKNWKATMTWAPSSQFRFRGTLGQSFRQPNVYEMYQGATISSQSQLTDPYGKDTSPQLPMIIRGNRNLRPELGRTYTFGGTYTPRQFPNLSISVDYWHTRIKNLINPIPGQNMLQHCYNANPNDPTCNGQIHRSAGGVITGIETPYSNLGGERTDGIDWNLNYSWQATRLDRFTLTNNLQQLLSYKVQYGAGQPWMNYSGRVLYNQASTPGSPGGLPKIRDYATLTWKHANFSLTYMMQYMGGMTLNDGVCDANNARCAKRNNDGSIMGYKKSKVAGMFSHDITANFRVARWNMEAGIQNITGQKPPFVPDGGYNTAASLYGNLMVGRFFFMQVGTSF